MSNILIIKHGSLGDLIQANGAIADIKAHYKSSKIFLLTTRPYVDLMSHCPYVDGILIDKRLPRWNIFYLVKLKKLLNKFNFSHIYDLQNSRRTQFYKKFLLRSQNWSSSETTLKLKEKKKDFDNAPVLDRMEEQLNKNGIKTNKIKNIDLSWALLDLSRLIRQHSNNKYILVFPFCSKKHKNKKWPYFKNLINKLKEYYKNKYSVLIIPGPDEIDDSRNFNAKVVLNDGNVLNIQMLITLINSAEFIISNDTGPAHIASHLNKKGLVLFGSHTSAKKVSIINNNFKSINVKNLKNLKVETVLENINSILN